MELDLAQPFGRSLAKEKIVILRLVHAGNLGEFSGIEEVVGHEFDDQGHVHVHRSLQLRQRTDVPGSCFKVHVLFKTLGCYDVP